MHVCPGAQLTDERHLSPTAGIGTHWFATGEQNSLHIGRRSPRSRSMV